MAHIKGWAKLAHRAKARVCKLDSYGHSFAQLGGPPVDAHLTFTAKIANLEQQLIVAIDSNEEALDIIRCMHDFLDRRGAYHDKAKRNGVAGAGPAATS